MRQLEPLKIGNPFYSPFNGLVMMKSEEAEGRWLVYLQASNETPDQDGETTLRKALEVAKDYYISHGVLSWDHKHKELHDPAFIIGEPLDVAFNNKNETLVKGFLYKENRRAQAVWENIQSGAQKLGASIGGYVLHKSKGANSDKKTIIDTVYWDETAITHKPVNDSTFGNVTTIPFAELAKALTAGSGVNAAEFTGGRALTPEGGLSEPSITEAEATQLFQKIWGAIASGEIGDYLSLLGFVVKQGYTAEIAKKIATTLYEKLPSLVSSI